MQATVDSNRVVAAPWVEDRPARRESLIASSRMKRVAGFLVALPSRNTLFSGLSRKSVTVRCMNVTPALSRPVLVPLLTWASRRPPQRVISLDIIAMLRSVIVSLSTKCMGAVNVALLALPVGLQCCHRCPDLSGARQQLDGSRGRHRWLMSRFRRLGLGRHVGGSWRVAAF